MKNSHNPLKNQYPSSLRGHKDLCVSLGWQLNLTVAPEDYGTVILYPTVGGLTVAPVELPAWDARERRCDISSNMQIPKGPKAYLRYNVEANANTKSDQSGKSPHPEPRKDSEQADINHTARNPLVHRCKLPSSSYG